MAPLMLTVSQALDEYAKRFVHYMGRAPNEQDMAGAVRRFNEKYHLMQGVDRSDLDEFLMGEAFPPIPDKPPPPVIIYLPEAVKLLELLWVETYGTAMTPPKRTEGLQHYQVSSGSAIDKDDFLLWAKWWVKRFP